METWLHGGPQTHEKGGTSDGVQSELKAAASEEKGARGGAVG